MSEFDDAEGGFDDAESEQLRRPSAYSPARHVREWLAGERNERFLGGAGLVWLESLSQTRLSL